MGKRLEKFCEVRIVDDTNGVGLDFMNEIEQDLEKFRVAISLSQVYI